MFFYPFLARAVALLALGTSLLIVSPRASYAQAPNALLRAEVVNRANAEPAVHERDAQAACGLRGDEVCTAVRWAFRRSGDGGGRVAITPPAQQAAVSRQVCRDRCRRAQDFDTCVCECRGRVLVPPQTPQDAARCVSRRQATGQMIVRVRAFEDATRVHLERVDQATAALTTRLTREMCERVIAMHETTTMVHVLGVDQSSLALQHEAWFCELVRRNHLDAPADVNCTTIGRRRERDAESVRSLHARLGGDTDSHQRFVATHPECAEVYGEITSSGTHAPRPRSTTVSTALTAPAP